MATTTVTCTPALCFVRRREPSNGRFSSSHLRHSMPNARSTDMRALEWYQLYATSGESLLAKFTLG